MPKGNSLKSWPGGSCGISDKDGAARLAQADRLLGTAAGGDAHVGLVLGADLFRERVGLAVLLAQVKYSRRAQLA
jgi:hypothetical protein